MTTFAVLVSPLRKLRRGGKMSVAAADGSPYAPGVQEPVPEHGAPSVHPNIPNSRRGRVASPHVQGRETDVFVGMDVAKDRLDICVRPSGETFAVTRDGQGLERLVERLRAFSPALVALEATGGYETVVASALAAAHLPPGGDQSASDPRFRPFDRQARQNRSSRRRCNRPLRRRHSSARPARRGRRSPGAGRAGGRRRQVIEMIVAEKNRRRLAGQPRVLKAIDRHVDVLQAELSELDRDIDGAIRKSPAWQADADLLASVPGVGKAHSAHPHRRTAGAWAPRSAQDREPRWRCSHQSRQRRLARPKDNRRRPRASEGRPLHGRTGHQPLEPRHRRALSKTPSMRQSPQTGAYRMHPQAPRHPQRYLATSKALDPPGLTTKTVALDSVRRHCGPA